MQLMIVEVFFTVYFNQLTQVLSRSVNDLKDCSLLSNFSNQHFEKAVDVWACGNPNTQELIIYVLHGHCAI